MCISHSQFNDTFTGLLAFSFDKHLMATAFCCVLVFRKGLLSTFLSIRYVTLLVYCWLLSNLPSLGQRYLLKQYRQNCPGDICQHLRTTYTGKVYIGRRPVVAGSCNKQLVSYIQFVPQSQDKVEVYPRRSKNILVPKICSWVRRIVTKHHICMTHISWTLVPYHVLCFLDLKIRFCMCVVN